MNQERFAGGWDCQEVQSASRVSPIWYFSFIPVILGFSSGKSEQSQWDGVLPGGGQPTNYLHVGRLDEGEEGGVRHHLTAVAARVVKVDIPQEESPAVWEEPLPHRQCYVV